MSDPGRWEAFDPKWFARQEMTRRGDVVTFYSYKGGTGRSMALANCAALLSQGRPEGVQPLLLIDFDLEAPGLHRYFREYDRAASVGADRPGTLEFFQAVRDAVDGELATRSKEGNLAERLDDVACAAVVDQLELSPFLIQLDISGLFLMQAGRFDDDYHARLTGFRWEELYSRAPGIFRAIAARFAREFSFTLIDARTGLSDTFGLCTALLPDTLVSVFTPNRQSLAGINHVVRMALQYRAKSTDLRPLIVYPLVSRVDTSNEHYRRAWRDGCVADPTFGDVDGFQPMFRDIFRILFDMPDEAESRLGYYFDVVQVPHSADYAFGERLVIAPAAANDRYSLRKSFEDFLPWLVSGAYPWQSCEEVLSRTQAERQLVELRPPLGAKTSDEGRVWLDRLMTLHQAGRLIRIDHWGSLPDEYTKSLGIYQAIVLAWSGEWRESSTLLSELSGPIAEFGLDSEEATALVTLAEQVVEKVPPVDLAKRKQLAWRETISAILASDSGHRELMRRYREVVYRWCKAIGDAAGAERVLRELLDGGIANHRSEPERLRIEARIAACRLEMADVAGAKDRIERILAQQEQEPGVDRADILSSRTLLGRILLDQGQDRAALELQSSVLDERRRRLGPDHRLTRTSAILTARALLSLRRAKEALDLLPSLTAGAIEAIDDPLVLTEADLRANALTALGKNNEAKAIDERVLAERVRLLGAGHPESLSSMANLAVSLSEVGDIAGALELERRVVATLTDRFGPDHPDTLAAMRNLASSLADLGNYQEALQLLNGVVDGQTRRLGPEHADTLDSTLDLAIVLWKLGDAEKARRLEEQVLETRKRQLGPDHPDTLTSIDHLAATLSDLGDLDGARTMQEQVLEARRKVFGPEHPDTLVTMNNLAGTLFKLGEVDNAVTLEREALGTCERVFGSDSQDTLRAKENLGLTYLELERFDEAREMLSACVHGRSRVLGDRHPDTIQARHELGQVLLRTDDDVDAAEPLLRQALIAAESVFGESSEIWRGIAEDLAAALERLDRHKDALDLLKRLHHSSRSSTRR